MCSLSGLQIILRGHIFDTITQNFCRTGVFQTFENSVSLTILFRYHVMLKDESSTFICIEREISVSWRRVVATCLHISKLIYRS